MPVRENDVFQPDRLRASIERALERRGLAATSAGKKNQVGERTVGKFFKGGTNDPRISTLIRLADAIGGTVGELVGEISPERETSEREAFQQQLIESQQAQIRSLNRQLELQQEALARSEALLAQAKALRSEQ